MPSVCPRKLPKQIAKEVLKKSPLVVFLLITCPSEVKADVEERGILFVASNRLLPAALFEEIFGAASHGMSDWIENKITKEKGFDSPDPSKQSRLGRFDPVTGKMSDK